MSLRSATILRETGVWGIAASSVIALHVAGLWWLHSSAEAATPPGLPEAVFVDLAPMPEASAPQDIVESEEQAEAAPEPEPMPEPEPEPEIALDPLPELQPLPDLETLHPPPSDAVVMQSSRPRSRPERPKPEPEPKTAEVPREPVRQRERRREAPEEQVQTQRSTTVAGRQSNRNAAQQGGGQSSARAEASWKQQIQGRVARHMQRARIDGRRGTIQATLTVTVSGNGQVSGVSLTRSSGDARVDQALSRQAGRMPRLVAPPSGRTETVIIPFQISSR